MPNNVLAPFAYSYKLFVMRKKRKCQAK